MSVKPVSRRLVLAGALSIAAWNLGALEGGEAVASSPTLRWLSGAGDPQPGNIGGGGFGTWRGESTTFARIWADASLKDMGRLWMMDSYKSSEWAGTLDIACGGPREGQTWSSAATGGMDSTWRATCRSVRRKWGKLVGVQLSMAHEMNGSWYPWSVTSATVEDFKKAWARWHGIVNEELVEKGKHAKICLSMNANTISEVSVQELTPDTKYFDVVGCDYYSMWPDLRDESTWDDYKYATGATGSPRGIQAWFDYARSLGKPISFPEWGVNPETRSDNPFFIRKMRDIFAANGCSDPAKPGSGQVAGEAYFNHSDNNRLWPKTDIPSTAQQYRSLKWGSN
jgi:Glycosyl hydrolase family 26